LNCIVSTEKNFTVAVTNKQQPTYRTFVNLLLICEIFKKFPTFMIIALSKEMPHRTLK